jgi:putative membrane protein
MQVIIIIILILAVLLVIFTLQNSVAITLNIFFWKINDAPLVLVLLSCVLLGYILASIYFYPRLWKIKSEYRQLIKFNKELKELHNMNHPEVNKSKHKENIDPEGIELDEDDEDSFFKD